MIDDQLVNDIYYKLKDSWSLEETSENNNILLRINNNIKLYGNTQIEEVDTEHSWIKIENPKINSIKFINTKGYAKHLKICKEVDEFNAELIKKNENNKRIFPYIGEWKEHPIPWDNFLVLKAYRCVLTKAVGFTYYIKNTYMIKPFNIIKHDWELKEISGYKTLYKCRACGTDGNKERGAPPAEVFPESDFMLSCNEHLIKKLLE